MPLSSTFNLGVLARTKNSMHPRGSRYPSSPVPPLYPMHTRGPLRPLPDGVPHRVVDAWRDLRVWGGVDVEVGGLRPLPCEHPRWPGVWSLGRVWLCCPAINGPGGVAARSRDTR